MAMPNPNPPRPGVHERRVPSARTARRAAVLMLAAAILGGCPFEPGPVVGRRAPDYSGPSLDGSTFRLADHRGEVLLLNVWATWCHPCRREMPSLEALHQDFHEHGLRVVAVSIDAAGAKDEIRSFLEEFGITFLTVHDSEQHVARAFWTHGVPETFLIGRNGRIVHHWIGRIDGRSESVRERVREALAG